MVALLRFVDAMNNNEYHVHRFSTMMSDFFWIFLGVNTDVDVVDFEENRIHENRFAKRDPILAQFCSVGVGEIFCMFCCPSRKKIEDENKFCPTTLNPKTAHLRPKTGNCAPFETSVNPLKLNDDIASSYSS